MFLSSVSTGRSLAGWRLCEQAANTGVSFGVVLAVGISRSTLFLTAKWRSGIICAGLYWGVAKWQGTGFWSRDRRFESCRPSRGECVVRDRRVDER
jgi:hypothetical protein